MSDQTHANLITRGYNMNNHVTATVTDAGREASGVNERITVERCVVQALTRVQERKISRSVHRHGQLAVQLRYTGDLDIVHTGRANVAAHVSELAEGKIAGDRESATRRKRAINGRCPPNRS